MTVRRFYELLGEDYDAVVGRLMKDELICRFLLKFQSGNYLDKLREALEAEDWEQAFLVSHSLKGMCLNLELGRLGQASHNLCEALRPKRKDERAAALYEEVKTAYEEAAGYIDELA